MSPQSKPAPRWRAAPVRWLAALAFALLPLLTAHAGEPRLTLEFDRTTAAYTAAELLARPDVAEIAIPRDVSYGQAWTVRAVPVLSLIPDLAPERADTVEARALDGFVAQIPTALLTRAKTGGAVAWLAIEDPAQPWPRLNGRGDSAGPFYLVWLNPERSGVVPEQWPYQLVSLRGVQSPAQRWPWLAVAASVPAADPARRGQDVYVAQCLPCHKLNGAGGGAMGPDLGAPMPVLAYWSEPGLRALIRNPRQVRAWPQMQMPGVDATTLPDQDLDALLAYLRLVAGRR